MLPLSALLGGLALLALGVNAARETMDEAAVHTRELIAYRSYNIGTLASTYPASSGELAGLPIPLQEYYAPFPDGSGDILLLAMPISKVFSNALPPNAPNITLTVSDLYGLGDGNLAAGRQRIALFGSLERVQEEEEEGCRKAYLEAHPDARGWVGAGGPHFSFYARLRVHKVFAFDGFGDVAFIGWLPLDLYRASGKLMRSRKEVLKHWREPVQPEELGMREEMFAETVGEVEEERERLRIQW